MRAAWHDVADGGLRPGARHRFVFYRLRGGEAIDRSASGQFRTAIAPGAREALTFAGLSCTNGHRPGFTQMDWLKAGLSASTAVFKFIVNSKPIGIPGAVWLAGDVHFGAVARLDAGLYEVIMGPGANERDTPVRLRRGVDWPVLAVDAAYDTIRNHTLVRADPATRTVTASFINGAGNVIPQSVWQLRV